MRLIPHQLPLTSTISNQTNLPPTHPLTADVNNDYLESNSSYSNGSIDKNTLKQILIYLRKNTELLVETNKITQVFKENDNQWYKEVWKSATRKLLKNGYIYPNETGFKDYFISGQTAMRTAHRSLVQ
ncbi:8950_t:CDS:2 [Entrophospora sp. SA101]|nr:8950_t:CDS:2 [Entrophospora sp. SA101]